MASASAARIPSRTAEGKHTPRFIILKKNAIDEKFVRSKGFPGFYATRAEAEAAIASMSSYGSSVQYKVRQK